MRLRFGQFFLKDYSKLIFFTVYQNKVWSSVARTLAMIEGNINWKKYCINVDLDNNLFSTHHFLNYRLCVMLNFDKRLFCRCSLSLLLGIIISKKEVGTSMGQGAVGIYKHFKCWTADNPFFELIITIKKRWLSGATSLSKLQQLKKKSNQRKFTQDAVVIYRNFKCWMAYIIYNKNATIDVEFPLCPNSNSTIKHKKNNWKSYKSKKSLKQGLLY